MSQRTITLALLLSLAVVPGAAAQNKEQVLYSFQGIPDGAAPVGGVVFDAAGNLYGATTGGGSASCGGIALCGTVYQLQPQGGTWTESILYVFQGKAVGDGETPAGGVILDSAGNLYGTTAYGGAGTCILLGGDVGCGTVYELTPPAQKGGAWTETVLYSFQGGNDGYLPNGNLVFDKAGNIYGATQYGGGFGTCNQGIYPYCGTIFELSPPKMKGEAWTEKVLYSFKSGTDGANPNGSLVLDKKGALYGTTYFGGNQGCPQDAGVGCGTVFKLTPPLKQGNPWNYELLYRFNEGPPRQPFGDGENPAAGVVLGRKGVLYGTTLRGSEAEGTIFSLTPPNKQGTPWTESFLHLFGKSYHDGWFPLGLTFDSKGNFYGLAMSQGAYGGGAIFHLKRFVKRGRSWLYSVPYSFMGPPDGEEPIGYPTLDENGNLYGITQLGGTGPCQGGCGAVFEFEP